MDHPYGKQYGQEGNPRAYITMRDYRNLPYQWGNQQPVERNPSEHMSMRDYRNLELQNQQPVGRNPNPNMSLREYRDKWMSAPVYSVPSTYPPPPQYDHPEPPFYASTPQSQQPLSLSPVEQAVLDLGKVVNTNAEDQKVLNDQTNQRIAAFESSVNRNLSNIYAAISRLSNQFVHQEEENLEVESQEEESLTETVLVEQVQLQPQEELEVELVKAHEDLQETTVNFWPWTKAEQITALLTEKSSGHETLEGTQEPNIDLDTTATAQATKCPLPIAPSTDLVYIQPPPTANPKPATPAPKARSNPSLHAMKNLKILVASVHTFATTSKNMANAYIAWHSGWFGCGFGFGAPGPRHF